jgi:hypothetical protein
VSDRHPAGGMAGSASPTPLAPDGSESGRFSCAIRSVAGPLLHRPQSWSSAWPCAPEPGVAGAIGAPVEEEPGSGSGPRSRTPLSGSKARRATTTPARTVGCDQPPRRAATHLKRSVARAWSALRPVAPAGLGTGAPPISTIAPVGSRPIVGGRRSNAAAFFAGRCWRHRAGALEPAGVGEGRSRPD